MSPIIPATGRTRDRTRHPRPKHSPVAVVIKGGAHPAATVEAIMASSDRRAALILGFAWMTSALACLVTTARAQVESQAVLADDVKDAPPRAWDDARDVPPDVRSQ